MANGIGVDISGYQPEDVPGNWEFIVVKITEGNYESNHNQAAQWRNAARTTRGVYHYARIGRGGAVQQADFFCDRALQLGFTPGTDIWQLDAEDGLNNGVTNEQWQQYVTVFMDRALQRLGPRGFLYAGWYFVLSHGLQDHIRKYKWWLPAYGPNDGVAHPFPPGVPSELVVIHQFTSHGNLDQNHIIDHVRYGDSSPPAPPPKPDVPQDTGVTVDMANARTGIISTVFRADIFGSIHTGTFDAKGPVSGCNATIHGPDPHAADPSSPDDFWNHIVGATVTCQQRGEHVVVTVYAPRWKAGNPPPQVHVTAYV